jgi:cyclase
MLRRRVIACLDVRGGRVVKGEQFESLREVGDPVQLAMQHERDGADELVLLDIAASAEERATLCDVVRRTAERVFIPLTVGGGVRCVDDIARVLRAGADKVCINTAAVERPAVLTEAAARFGAQCTVASIDARRNGASWQVFTRGGTQPTGLDVVAWARECVVRGAGEILLTSIDRDGTRSGYDIALTRAVASSVNVPVIASGGAGGPAHVVDVLEQSGADAALVAGVLHDGRASLAAIKQAMRAAGLPARSAA